MDKLLKNVLSCMRTKGLLDESEEDVYRFGLECLLLEVVHYLSYIVIGFAMRMIIPMIVTSMVLIPLRRKSGGFHAKTRSGCYLFSCSIVVAVCLLDKIFFAIMVMYCNYIWGKCNYICICSNRKWKSNIRSRGTEKNFRKQALIILVLSDIAIIVLYKIHIEVCQWLLNGMIVAALLNLCGKNFRQNAN